MPTDKTITTVWKPVKRHVAPVVAEVANRYGPLYYVWGYDGRKGRTGEHPKGLAIDFSILDKGKGVSKPGRARMELGQSIAEYLWRNRVRLNVWYIVWNRRIISRTYESSGWRKYSGRNPHTDHVHVSFYANRTYRPPSPAPTPKPKSKVSLSTLVLAAKADPRRRQGGTTPGAADDVKVVESALRREGLLSARYAGDGSFGSLTVKAYAAWQRRCGYHGRDADGIPGKASLTMLGKRYGFTVVR